jgi:hypothetical protein
MTKRNNKGGQLATAPAYLTNVIAPMDINTGVGHMPEEAQRIRAKRLGTNPHPNAIDASRKAWSAYIEALNAADLAQFNGQPPCGRRRDALAHVYNRARLQSWKVTLGDEGVRHWALHVAESNLKRALNKLTGGAITIDLIPDLPRRCDLTDTALDVAERLDRGLDYWHSLRRDLEAAADDCAREALDELGWEGEEE